MSPTNGKPCTQSTHEFFPAGSLWCSQSPASFTSQVLLKPTWERVHEDHKHLLYCWEHPIIAKRCWSLAAFVTDSRVCSQPQSCSCRQPAIVDIQILRVGQLVILCVPGEFTTMAGRRIKEAIYDQVLALCETLSLISIRKQHAILQWKTECWVL